jgi:hypothetical protein
MIGSQLEVSVTYVSISWDQFFGSFIAEGFATSTVVGKGLSTCVGFS